MQNHLLPVAHPSNAVIQKADVRVRKNSSCLPRMVTLFSKVVLSSFAYEIRRVVVAREGLVLVNETKYVRLYETLLRTDVPSIAKQSVDSPLNNNNGNL